jgi:hypothetical protein
VTRIVDSVPAGSDGFGANAQESWQDTWRVASLTACVLGLTAIYAARHLPGWPRPPRLSAPDSFKLFGAGRALGLLLVVQLAALGAARPLRGLYAAVPSWLLRAVLRLTLGLVVLGFAVFALGVARLLRPTLLWGLLSVCALVGLGQVAVSARLLFSRARSERRAIGLAALSIGLAFGLPLLCSFVPVYGWDGLTYHLALPERFLAAGRIFVAPESIYTSLPLLMEMLYTLALAIGTPALAKLLNLEMGVLLVLALVPLARRFAPHAWPLAIVVMLADPLFLWELTVAYNDLAIGLFALLAAEALLDWRASLLPASLGRAAFFCGACAAAKYQGAFVAVALCGALLLDVALPLRRRLTACVALSLGALALLSPWLVRNLLATGDLFARGFYDPIFLRQMLAFNRSVGMGRSLGLLLVAPWNVTMHSLGAEVTYVHAFGYAIGPLPLMCVAGALWLPPVRRRPEVRLLLRSVGVLFLIWFFTIQEARYLLPTFALLGVIGAVVGEWLYERAPRWAMTLGATAVLPMLALAHLAFWNANPHAYRIALGDVPEGRGAAPAELAAERLRTTLPTGGRLLVLFEPRGFYLRGLDYVPFIQNEGSPILLAMHSAFAKHATCAWLRSESVTHVLVNWPQLEAAPVISVEGYTHADFERDMLGLRAFLTASATRDFEVGGVAVYALNPETCREPTIVGP